jgi:anti-repressor protein
MEEIFKVIEKEGNQKVSARDLHSFVEMHTRFDIWIKRMFKYGFVENVDYQCLIKNTVMPNGGFKTIIDDYILTLDCAKHIAIIQKNDKGKQVRKYFIDCEKKFRALNTPKTLKEALQLAVEQQKLIEKQQMTDKYL